MSSIDVQTAKKDTAGAGARATRWEAITGIVFAVLAITGIALTWGSPSTSDNPFQVRSWYLSNQDEMSASAVLLVLAVIAGLFFLNYVRSCFRRRDAAGWMTSLFWAGAIVFAVSGALGAGINTTLGDNPAALTPGSLQVLNALESNLNYPTTCVGLAVMFLGAGLVIRKTGVLPQWLSWASWVLAILAATVVLGFIAFLATALWVIVVAVILALRNPPTEQSRPQVIPGQRAL